MKYVWVILGIIIVGIGAYFAIKSYYPKKATAPSTSEVTPSGTSVSISNFSFQPAELKVKAGQEITFTNNESVIHTITADDKSFDSGNVKRGGSFKHTFDKTGTFSYHCSLHSTMKGKIIVE